LGVAKFTFADELTASVSDRLYGEANVYPKFDFDYTPFEWIVGIAAHLSVGLHRQSGIGAEKNSTAQSIQDDPSGSETTRKFYPLQLGVSARIPVLPKKLVVLDGKLAYEYLIAREVREDGVASSDDSYVTKASKSGVTFGLGASICLNGLSQKAVSAMRNSINIGYVYLRGYYEVSAQLDTSQGADFSRNTFGVSIVAETF
jgi:hypothetical protein